MSTRDVTIAMTDGATLAATLYLPDTALMSTGTSGTDTGTDDARPRPCLLEALPYRKDDVTASYTPEYERLRDEFGYAVCRLDLRGTGSSTGIATDEYPPAEQADLVEVIAWLAAQPWCDGNVGMYGTSYSGFNSIQVAMRRPPALRAIVPIYATDDRYTDDVHYMGGVRRLLDIVDYPTYMVAMNALPPVPEVFGEGWRDEWRRRLDGTPPWLLRWTAERQDGPYWRHGSLRPDYGAITVPTMIVAGWADGYRNNTLRTYAALTAAGTPTRLLIGPWSHQGADTARPGPHVDLCREMARWFDRWLRGADNGVGASTDADAPGAEPSIVYFARSSTPPAPDTALHRGEWRAESRWPSPRFAEREVRLGGGVREHVPLAGTGTAAWNSCAGALPWGQPTDQRYDDAASLVWEWPADGLEILGHPVLDARIGFDTTEAAVSAKLCDVAPDGTSTLVTRGLTRLAEPGAVRLDLEATSWTFAPGHRARLSVTGMDWPNTLAAPEPFTMTLDGDTAALRLPVAVSPPVPAPATLATIDPPATIDLPATTDPPAGITWRVVDDVLARVTSAEVDHGSTYPIRGGQCSDHYTGHVAIDRRTWRQRARSSAAYRLNWGDLEVSAEAAVLFTADEREVTLEISLVAREGDATVAERTWRATHPRSVG